MTPALRRGAALRNQQARRRHDLGGCVLHLSADFLATTTEDGSTFTKWPDRTGFANDAIQNSGPNQPIFRASIAGHSCVQFDGVNDFLTLPNNAQLNINDALSITAWINTGASGIIVGGANPAAAFEGYEFKVKAGATVLQYWNGTAAVDGTRTVTSSTWRHVAMVAQSKSVWFYVDGVLDNSPGNTGAPNFWAGVRAIGSEAGGAQRWFNGYLRDIRIFARPLTAGSVRQLFMENLR